MGNSMHKRIYKNILASKTSAIFLHNMTVDTTMLPEAGCYSVSNIVNKIDGPEGNTFFGKLIVETVMRNAHHVVEREDHAKEQDEEVEEEC